MCYNTVTILILHISINLGPMATKESLHPLTDECRNPLNADNWHYYNAGSFELQVAYTHLKMHSEVVDVLKRLHGALYKSCTQKVHEHGILMIIV